MGAEPQSAEQNACRVEHVLTEDVFELIKQYVGKSE
ncbi:MAG: iron dependent repressor, metal binding and dimerization domain protein [Christensenellaceae bacterium]